MNSSFILGFTGAYLDPILSGYPLGNGYRVYLPSMMRFSAPDESSPFDGGGLNPYSYCAGDPINRIDPSGHMFEDIEGMNTVEAVSAKNPTHHPAAPDRPHPSSGSGDRPIATQPTHERWAALERPNPPVTSRPLRKPQPPSSDSSDWRSRTLAPRGPKVQDRTLEQLNDRERRQVVSARTFLEKLPENVAPEHIRTIEVPQHAWRDRGYEMTVRFGIEFRHSPKGRVEFNVHYTKRTGTWESIMGHIWMPGVPNFQWKPPQAVVSRVPTSPPAL